MIQVFKIINGLDDLNWRDFFIKAVSNVTRHSEHKLFVRYSRTNKRKNTFSIRVVPVWNGLCQILLPCVLCYDRIYCRWIRYYSLQTIAAN